MRIAWINLCNTRRYHHDCASSRGRISVIEPKLHHFREAKVGTVAVGSHRNPNFPKAPPLLTTETQYKFW